MKKIKSIFLVALALSSVPGARAWTYNDGDVLLVFRKTGYNNVEFDLGNISQFTGKTNGYTTTVAGWNTSLVTTTFGTDLTGVSVVLLAATSPTNATPTAWLSGSEPNTTAYQVSAAEWSSSLYGVISAVGNRPVNPYNVPASDTNAYSIDPYGIKGRASYDYTVTAGRYTAVTSLGGNAPFKVEQIIPGFLDFWAIQPTSVYPNPPADTLVGTFTITASGALTFVAGPRASVVGGVNRTGTVSAVSFSTTVGNTYSLAYTNQLGGPVTTWPVDATTVIGDGTTLSINHTNSSNVEFYKIITQ